MNRVFVRLLVVAAPGVGFVVAGAVTREYPVMAAGIAMVGGLVYSVIRQHSAGVPVREHDRPWISFSLASMIGSGIIIDGFDRHRYWLVGVGGILVVGSLTQISRFFASRRRAPGG